MRVRNPLKILINIFDFFCTSVNFIETLESHYNGKPPKISQKTVQILRGMNKKKKCGPHTYIW
jgi:hypothetical protein